MSVYQTGNQDLDLAISYDANNRDQYIGEAKPGTAVDAAGWRIFRLEYDGTSTRMVKKRFANANSTEFNKVWDDRASYDYVE